MRNADGFSLITPKNNIRDIPWVERYRPETLDDIASQKMTIMTLKEFVKKESIPHLIFAGPAGTGKTSAAISLINDLLGKENITQDAILERNASDSVRMSTRDEIKNFVNHLSINDKNKFKFVILDEADNISRSMQGAFRRIIEMAPSNVKFIFMCNFVENIIDPLLSRCAIFRFYPLPKKEFSEQLNRIAKNEFIPLEQKYLDAIYYISKGDMRQAINLFQMIVALLEDEDKEGKLIDKSIDFDVIYEISGFLPPKLLNSIFINCENNKFIETLKEYSKLKGVSSRALFRQISTKILNKDYTYPKLEELMVMLGEYDYRLSLNADYNIQIDGFFASIISILECEI